MHRFFSISVVLLLSWCAQAFGKDIRVSAFPAAIFSPGGQFVYYVQSDLVANVRRTGSFSLVYARNKEIRIISEVLSIHRFELATGRNETVATLQRPPWVGTRKWVPRQFWFDGESAKMWWTPAGEMQYEVRGPTTTTVNQQGVRETKQWSFVSFDPKWTDSSFGTPRSTLRAELKYVVSGSMELITSWFFGDYGSYYLVILDHDRRTIKVLATGSDWDRKLADKFDYEGMLDKSRLKGPLKNLK